jgi:hypothetical protein
MPEEFFEATDSKAKDAQNFLTHLQDDLERIEKERIINLNNPVISRTGLNIGLPKGEVLEISLEHLRPLLNYLDPKKKHLAEGLIMKAELYLAAHDPTQATKSPTSGGPFVSQKECEARMKSFSLEKDQNKDKQ